MHVVEKRAIKGTLFGLIQFGLTFVQSVLLVPLLLTQWGQEKYGMYLAIFAFLQLLKTIDFGHQTYVGNEFNKIYFQNRSDSVVILGSSMMMALILGGVELLIFLGLWF